MMLSFHLQFLSCWPYFQMICTPDVSEPFRLSFVHWFLPVDWLCKTYSYWIVNMYYASVLVQLAANSLYWMLSIEINVNGHNWIESQKTILNWIIYWIESLQIISNWIIYWSESQQLILNWTFFYIEFSWNYFESNQFWVKFKHWIESI